MTDIVLEEVPPGAEVDLLHIAGENGLLVAIKCDGTIEYGPKYEADEAARHFWEALLMNGMRWEPIALAAGWTPPSANP